MAPIRTMTRNFQAIQAPISVLDPYTIFRGKMHACAIREKHSDAADVKWLINYYESEIRAGMQQRPLDTRVVGHALARHTDIAFALQRAGFDVAAAERLVAGTDTPFEGTQPHPFAVQTRLLRQAFQLVSYLAYCFHTMIVLLGSNSSWPTLRVDCFLRKQSKRLAFGCT